MSDPEQEELEEYEPINPIEQIDKVRYNLGKTASSNVTDEEIDKALSSAEDTVLEDTGFNTKPDKLYAKPDLIIRLKVLNATADLLIGFSEKVDLRESILKEIARNNKKITNPEVGDSEDETIIEGTDYATYPMNQYGGGYWSGVKQREVKRFGQVGEGQEGGIF